MGEHILKKLEKKETIRFEEMMKECDMNKEGFEQNKDKIMAAKEQGKKLSKKLKAYDDFARISVDGIIHMYRERELSDNQNDYEEDDEIELELSEDIYCITFIKFLKDEPLVQRELMMKSVIAFIMQAVLIGLISFEAIKQADFGTINIYSGTWKINCTRLLCAFLLHMTVVPEVRTALDLMKYAKNNGNNFNGRSAVFPFMIAFMKLFGGLTTEIINILIIL